MTQQLESTLLTSYNKNITHVVLYYYAKRLIPKLWKQIGIELIRFKLTDKKCLADAVVWYGIVGEVNQIPLLLTILEYREQQKVMGYSKSKIPQEVKIAMSIRTTNNDNGTETVDDVVHVLKPPSTTIREEHQRLLVKTKGKKIQTGSIPDANFFLWKNCILRVEGYDDIGATVGEPNYKEALYTYFGSDSVLRLHIDEVIDRLNDRLSAEDTDTLKKSEPFAAQ